jgi:hypothetical protein
MTDRDDSGSEPQPRSPGSRALRRNLRGPETVVQQSQPSKGGDSILSILWIILIVILVLALLGFFSRGRW